MVKQTIKKTGLRVTLPRIKVLEVLCTSKKHHMSAETIHKALLDQGDKIGIATVYRVLTQFESVGLLKRYKFADERSVFEFNSGAHHDHLVCVNCAAIEEFVDPVIESRQEAIADRFGFKITDHRLTLYGLCESCLSRDNLSLDSEALTQS